LSLRGSETTEAILWGACSDTRLPRRR